MNIVEKVLQSMRFGRKYSAGFISHRQNIPISSVRHALNVLEHGLMVTSEKAKGNGRRKLFMTNQRELNLI